MTKAIKTRYKPHEEKPVILLLIEIEIFFFKKGQGIINSKAKPNKKWKYQLQTILQFILYYSSRPT